MEITLTTPLAVVLSEIEKEIARRINEGEMSITEITLFCAEYESLMSKYEDHSTPKEK